MENIDFTVKMISQDGMDRISYDSNFYIEDGILYHGAEEIARDVEDDILYAVQRIVEFCHDTVLEITDQDDEVVYKNEEFEDEEIEDEEIEDEEDFSKVVDFRFKEDYKSLNEKLEKFLEGDVVSFVDYKRKKQSDKFLKDNEEELNKLMEDKVFVDITGIDIIWAEGRNDGINSFKDGEKLSYEEFQKRAYEYSYALKDRVGVDKVKITVHFTINGEEDTYNTMIFVGDDKNLEFKDVNLQRVLSRNWKEAFDGKEIIIRNTILPEDMDFNNLKYAKPEKEEVEEEPLPDYVKDYTKDPQDVAVGDILTCSWGYSMTIVDYYRVTERKAKSIKLEKLATKTLTGGGYQGTCMPSNERAANRFQTDIQNKLFRIGVKWSKDVVCQINGHSVYYWDGKPDHYDHMD